MSKIDKDLFELCRNVYEATGWSTEKEGIVKYLVYVPILGNKKRDLRDKYKLLTIEQCISDYGIDFDSDTANFTPLYTSDYLLEKLPESTDKFGDFGVSRGYSKGEPAWRFYFQKEYGNLVMDDEQVEGIADTPLKALLKLAIALDDAGVKL